MVGTVWLVGCCETRALARRWKKSSLKRCLLSRELSEIRLADRDGKSITEGTEPCKGPKAGGTLVHLRNSKNLRGNRHPERKVGEEVS